MKKIILTTEQLNKITEHVSSQNLNESINNDRYETECTIDFNYGGELKYNGNEVELVECSYKVRVSYLIEMEHRSWGIKDVSLYDIQGPEEIEADITYYEGDSDDPTEETITIKLSWEGVDVEKENGGVITIDNDVEIDLNNDQNGEIVATSIGVVVYSI